MSRKMRARLEAQSLTSSPARTPLASKNASRNPSAGASKANSKAGSDMGSVVDENETLGVGRTHPDMDSLFDQLQELGIADVEQGLDDLVEKMQDRDFFKGPATERAKSLNVFANSLAQLCATPAVQGFEGVVPVVVRCLKEGSDSASCVPACRVLALLVLIDGHMAEDQLGEIVGAVKAAVMDNSNVAGQAAAITALGHIIFFGSTISAEVLDTMNFLMEIVQTDGDSVDSKDSVPVVDAAMQTWAFLSTMVKPEHFVFGEAISNFRDQLESSSMDIILTAAQAIALLYERQWTLKMPEEDVENGTVDHSSSSSEGESQSDGEEEEAAKPLYRRSAWKRVYHYSAPYHVALRTQLTDILSSRQVRRNVPKKDLPAVKMILRDVIYSLGRPYRGPRYQRAWRKMSDEHVGHRLSIEDLKIDRWWKFWRLGEIRKLLRAGMTEGLHGLEPVKMALSWAAEPTSRFWGKKRWDEEEEEEEEEAAEEED
jgi:hypothetical protein